MVSTRDTESEARPSCADERPLEALAIFLGRGLPPSLNHLLGALTSTETYQYFAELVLEYLPDHKQEIMEAGNIQDMVEAFGKAFSECYFPLASQIVEGDVESLEELTGRIPLDVFGWEWDDYHELPDDRDTWLLAAVLVDFEGELDMGGEGVNITAMEAAERLVDREDLAQLPPGGYGRKYLEEKLKGSRFAGLLAYVAVLCHATGCVFFDYTNEEVWSNPPQWTREEVDGLTEHWRDYERIQKSLDEFGKWLEENPREHFHELIEFLEWRSSGRELSSRDKGTQLRLDLGLA